MSVSHPVDPARYRQVLGHFATGITVITAMHEGVPVGLAANSFTSVSIDPPLVLFCAGDTSTTWPRIEQAGTFCVNVLGDDQEAVSRQFASKMADKFEGIGWHKGSTGAPVIDSSLAWIDCTIDAKHAAGDHVIVVGRVHELGHNSGGPLLFYRGGYANLGR